MTPERLARLTGEIRWHDSAAIGQNDIAWIKAAHIALAGVLLATLGLAGCAMAHRHIRRNRPCP